MFSSLLGEHDSGPERKRNSDPPLSLSLARASHVCLVTKSDGLLSAHDYLPNESTPDEISFFIAAAANEIHLRRWCDVKHRAGPCQDGLSSVNAWHIPGVAPRI